MDKYIYNEKNGLWYEVQGDYDLPCLKLPEERTAYIGVWGQRHLRYLVSQGMLLHSADHGYLAGSKSRQLWFPDLLHRYRDC